MLTSCMVRHDCRCGTVHTQRTYRCRCGWLALSYEGAVDHLTGHDLDRRVAEGIVQAAIIQSKTAQEAVQ